MCEFTAYTRAIHHSASSQGSSGNCVGAEFLDRGSWVDSSMGLAAQTPDQVPEKMVTTLDGNPEIFETPHHMGRA